MKKEKPISIKIYNTPSKQKVAFDPYKDEEVCMYSCGPTVYNTVHIGNLRSLLNFDVVGRALRYMGYNLKRVVNFTDVGHMSSDADFGEDKIERQAKKENVAAMEIANKYISRVLESFRKVNILNPDGSPIEENIDVENMSKEEWAKLGWARATDYIDEMITLISLIEKNGHTYETEQALYFDISTFPEYFEFSGQKLEEKQIAVREEVKEDPYKKNPADFVLWMKRYGKYENHMMHWDSPWGDGFPGWHIECSAMSWTLLGEKIDIHTGGTDLVSVHHSNEIAQNVGAFGHDVVKYWLHNEFVYSSSEEKLSKSKGNALSLEEIEKLGIDLMGLRWYYLTSSYKSPMKFSIESLKSAEKVYLRTVKTLTELYGGMEGNINEEYVNNFKEAISDNFNTPKMLALLNQLIKSDLKSEDIVATAFEFDKVLGLDLKKTVLEGSKEKSEVHWSEVKIADLKIVLEDREKARKDKDWERSDVLREEILKMGYEVLDKEDGQYVIRI